MRIKHILLKSFSSPFLSYFRERGKKRKDSSHNCDWARWKANGHKTSGSGMFGYFPL